MTTLKSLFKIYGIKKALIKDSNCVEIVILKREKSLSLNDWENLIIGIKRAYNKEVNFLLEKDLKLLNYDTSSFLLVEDN